VGEPGSSPSDGDPQIRPQDLQGVFSVPGWLRDMGTAAWLLVGVSALVVAVIWLLSLTETIVAPVITAAIIAGVLAPLVRLLQRAGLKRAPAAALVFVTLIAVAAGLVLLVVGGIVDQAAALVDGAVAGADRARGWLEDLGLSAQTAAHAQSAASSGVSAGFHGLLTGVARGLAAFASLAVYLSFTAISLFFLLKDGPVIRRWAEHHIGVAPGVAHVISERVMQALRGYFTGVTIVAAFNAVVIGGAALALGVPRAGSIAVVNFVCGYVPYLGAWAAGAFTVLLALGAQGPDIALVMAVVALLANGVLQQLVQPVAYGAALDLHPLAVLVVTIAAGSLFGAIGLVVAAPLTSAAVRVSADLAAVRAHRPLRSDRKPAAISGVTKV
jgi:putative heme transporter